MRTIIFIVLLAVLGCGSGEDDTTGPTSEATSVTDNDNCPVTITAESAEEAVEEAEQETGGEAVGVEEVNNGGLDQGTALRVFRVTLKDITITINGCDNGVTINDNDSFSDDDTSVDLGGTSANE